LLVKLLDEIAATGEVPTGMLQDESAATFCRQLSREDGRIDWQKSAASIDAQMRAYHPWPGAWTMAGAEPIKVGCVGATQCDPGGRILPPQLPGTIIGTDKTFGILVQTGDGVLGLTRLQRAGKKEAAWQDFLNGWPGFCTIRFE
jgi:methionyl-tRNA formyltransferase